MGWQALAPVLLITCNKSLLVIKNKTKLNIRKNEIGGTARINS